MFESDIVLLVDFLNTIDLEAGSDVLADVAQYGAWCEARALPAGELAVARHVRGALRSAVSDPSGGAAGSGPLPRPEAIVTSTGVALVGSDAATTVTAAAARLTAADLWRRVKICPADACGEAFYDRSRNRSRVWCDMAACGNVQKVRTLRERARAV